MYKHPKLIEIMIDLVSLKYNKVYTDYKELAKVINKEFNEDITELDIWAYYEPESLDKMILTDVLGIKY